MLGMFGIRIMSGNQLLNGYANGITPNVSWLCVRWGFPALKPIDSTNFNLSTNDYR